MPLVMVGIVLFLSSAAGAEEWTFALEEVSVLELVKEAPNLVQGQAATCSRTPEPGVRAYPVLKSDKPVYGSAQFGSFFEEINPALRYHFVADESGGPGAGYDRLYVDLNGDKDLRNDVSMPPAKDPPPGLLLRYTSIAGQVLFENVGIPLPFGSEGLRPLEVTPRLLVLKGGGAMFSFVPTKARRGRIQIEGQEYDVLLSQTQPICGWFDHPETDFRMTPRGEPKTEALSSAPGILMGMPRLGGRYYRFAATPTGDRLLVQRYEGPLGDFEIGGSARFETTDIAAGGLLRSRDTIVSVDGPKCRLPVGDYLFSYVTVSHAGLTFGLQHNDHTDGGFRSRLYHARTYPIAIRAEKPFILDFSRRPEIVFADPPKGHRVKTGERLFVAALVADPVLDCVLCSLSYTPGNSAEQRTDIPALARDTTLHPRVTISRSDGEVVSEGIMHYGWSAVCRYLWQVPRDLKLDGNQETFTIEVVYDTRQLYGTMKARRQVVVHR